VAAENRLLRSMAIGMRPGLAHVIKVTCFLPDASAFPTLNALFAEFFPDAPPVRSAPIVQLPRGLLFSIDAIAVVKEYSPGRDHR
jgi:2-iminobutanoate/2-iminopropanoate deaminase